MTVDQIKRLLDLSEKHSRIRLIKAIYDVTANTWGHEIFKKALENLEATDQGYVICTCCKGVGKVKN